MTVDHALTCDEVEALLPLVADGSIDLATDVALGAHLGACTQCQDSLARHDLVDLALRRPSPSDRPRGRLHLPWPVALAVAASLVAAVGGSWWLFSTPAMPSAPSLADDPQTVPVNGVRPVTNPR